jgi:DNA-binding CsgD family transcriptional regulator
MLTARETRVVYLLSRGLSYAAIARQLGISVHTVGSHIKNAYRKLDVHCAAAAVMRAVELRTLASASPGHGIAGNEGFTYDAGRDP